MKTDSDRPSPRILCIAPFFAPVADSEAFCATKMVEALLHYGASVTVLSCSNIRCSFPACSLDMPNDGSRMWDWVRHVVIDVPTPLQPNLLDSVVSASQFQTPIFARWVGRVVEAAKLLHRASKFDLVYTRSLPMIAHVAGFWCAKKLRLPWVANINDPWEFNFFPGPAYHKFSAFQTRSYIFWLRRTLLNADLVTYPCKGLRDFHAKLAKLEHGAEIIPHIGSRPPRPSCGPNGQFRLVHAGKLGASEVTGRSPKGLLLGLKAFLNASADGAEHTRLVLVGPQDKETQEWISKLGLERNVENTGIVNYEDSLNYIASASACVLIESHMNESIFFPSKLADYLVCGKPVIALSPRIGIAADLASRGELVRVDQDDLEAVRNAISLIYSQFSRSGLCSQMPSKGLIAELQGHSVAQRFVAACEALTPMASNRERRGARVNRLRSAGSPLERLS